MTREEKNARHSAYMKLYRASPKGDKRRAYDREYQRRWRAANVEKVRSQERARYQRNVDWERADSRRKRNATREWLRDIKLASGCVDCGFKAHPDALHFDHLPQFEKKFHIGRQMAGHGKEAILAEISKCEVRCANCHAVKTALRRKGVH